MLKFLVATLLVILESGGAVRHPLLRRTSVERKPEKSKYKYETKWYNQTLDHFDFNNEIQFRQKYLINSDFWKVNSGPMFFYTGNEGVIEAFAENSGFIWDIAPGFNAIVVFAEHRYYGESLPFGKDYKNKTKVGYLTSEQALADYAELITYLKETIPGAANIPVIAFGGSYGGMLAAWFRMKYPHVCQGAIAASAPVAQFTTPCDAFGRIVTSDYSAAADNNTCSSAIRESWAALDRMGGKANGTGLYWLNTHLNLCHNFTHKDNVTMFKGYLNDLWTNLAMMDYPYPTSFLAPLPANPVNEACKHLTGIYHTDETLLTHIFQAASVYFNYTKTTKCLNLNDEDDIGADMWSYQACTEMVMPFCYDGVNDMFEPAKWNLDEFSKDCESEWGVKPRPNMANLMYGGRNINGASNIVFSNGLLDPWSSGSVLKTKNPRVITILIPEGAHHLDLRASDDADPKSVKAARGTESKAILNWIDEHWKEFRNDNGGSVQVSIANNRIRRRY